MTNIADGDHLGLNGIDTPEQLARVKRVPVEAVMPTGYAVLNAEDPLGNSATRLASGQIRTTAPR